MPLDGRFMIASDLQSLFRDKDTGLPLRNGVVYFWQDAERSVPKDVFKLSNSPPDYSYTNIGAAVSLTAAGTMSDNELPANDIILYYFPYEGDPIDNNQAAQLYYVEVYSEGGKDTGILQFTRSAWPNVVEESSTVADFKNYAPNGQFLANYEVPALDENQQTAGQIVKPSTPIAAGQWTYEQSPGSTAKDIVSFVPLGSYVTDPSGSPVYFLNVQCEQPDSGDTYKDICLAFGDVNKFASAVQNYTYAFSGQSNDTGSVSASMVIRKNFDDSGTNYTETTVANIIIPAGGFQIIQSPAFTFGDNIGQEIGAGNSVQLRVRLPVNSGFDVAMTDFVLAQGSDTIAGFPTTTDAQFQYESMPPAVPSQDGSSFYLPMVMTPNGAFYDASTIGEIVSESNVSQYVGSLHPFSNKMLMDGAQYETSGYSPLGIPFARIQAVYWAAALNLPIYGTGAGYFISVINDALPSELIISNNSPAIVNAAADGAVPTGFNFLITFLGQAADFSCNAWRIPGNGFYLQNKQAGTVTASTAGNSTYSVTTEQQSNSYLKQRTLIGPSLSTGEGTYFTFDVWTNGGDFGYYVWFQIDGAGTDPAVAGRTGILVNLTGGDTDDVVSLKIALALNTAGQIESISMAPGSAITPGAYFTISSSANNFYVWYTVDGTGIDPKPPGFTAIPASVLSTDTDVQVAVKTQIAINMKYFASPDARGMVFRAMDNGSGVDPGLASRYSYVPTMLDFGTDVVGTLQLDGFSSHLHSGSVQIPSTAGSPSGTDTPDVDVVSGAVTENFNTGYTGGYENRPFNMYANCAVRY